MCSALKQDSGDVWAPPHPQDLNTSFSAEKKSSHFWQSAPVTDWSKEQVFGISSAYLFSTYECQAWDKEFPSLLVFS
jgi:hypothetical protein